MAGTHKQSLHAAIVAATAAWSACPICATDGYPGHWLLLQVQCCKAASPVRACMDSAGMGRRAILAPLLIWCPGPVPCLSTSSYTTVEYREEMK